MRCYRCGAWMRSGIDTCPECGFFLNSPVEIVMFEEMADIRIYDMERNILWTGGGNDTAYVDAPDRIHIQICWGFDFRIMISIKNGEAYRFERRFSKMGKRKGDAAIIKTRTIPKKKYKNQVI